MNTTPNFNLLDDRENVITFLGMLIEKLGGSVTLTEAEVNNSLVGKTKSVFWEVTPEYIRLEVIPNGPKTKTVKA